MSRSIAELKVALAEVAKLAGSIPGGRSAFSELITEIVDVNHLSLDVFETFMSVARLNPGDYLTRKIRKGKFKARTMVPGAQHLTDAVIYNSQFNYVFDRLICGAHMNLWEVRSGEMGTIEELRRELRADLIDEIVSRGFNLLTTVWSAANTPSNFTDATVGGLTATVLDAAVENVIEKSGSVRSIVGTRKALNKAYGFAGYREFVLSDNTTRVALPIETVLAERFNTGRVSSYNGNALVELTQVLENRLPSINRKLIRDDVVLVIGADAGKVVLYGEPEDQEHTDTSRQPADYQIHMWQQYAMLVDRPEQIHVIKVA